MNNQDAFARILASLYDAMLDDTHWPATSALIDEACGGLGNALLVGEGPKNDIRVLFVGLYYRGQRRAALEREYLESYHPIDELVPRFRKLPESHLMRIEDLYTAEELKTSLTYNEILLRGKYQNGLNVRLAGVDSSSMTWGLGDPVASDGGVVARIVPGPHDAHRQDPHRPIRYDTGRPSSVIRLRISQPRTTSLPCPAGLRARRPSPMMDL